MTEHQKILAEMQEVIQKWRLAEERWQHDNETYRKQFQELFDRSTAIMKKRYAEQEVEKKILMHTVPVIRKKYVDSDYGRFEVYERVYEGEEK